MHTEPLRPSFKASNKKKKFWSTEADTLFLSILARIVEIPKIYHYDASKQSRIKCDTSHKGLGAALEQELEPDMWVPTASTSIYILIRQNIISVRTNKNYLLLYGHMIYSVINS